MKVAEAAERRRAGDKLAVPNPLDLMARCGHIAVYPFWKARV